MARKLAALIPVLALLAGACTTSSLLNKIDDESEKVVTLVCDECGIEMLNGQSCEDALSVALFDGADRDCIVDALNIDKSGSKESLECSLDVLKEYTSCIEENLACEDPASYSECAALFEGYSDCPQVSTEVNEAIGACYGGNDDN